MGGQNHQPCNKPGTSYLKHSTRMSRSASQAYLALEQANVHLEDVILAELEGNGGSIDPIVSSLEASAAEIENLRSQIRDLREEMERHDYADLPTLQNTDLDHLGERLVSDGMVSNDAWARVVGTMKQNGFFGVLRLFDASAKELVEHTHTLRAKIALLDAAAQKAAINRILEENQPGNIKVEFARLYTAWDQFHRLFLTSSMLSTELWYAFNGNGSLVEPGSSVRYAA